MWETLELSKEKILQAEIADFNAYLDKNSFSQFPNGLYDPIDYILSLGGKRIRPAMVLASHSLFNALDHNARKLAFATEVFHNFTLMHDDIMDAADVRRGQTTVHKKFDVNTAILSGDMMLIKAYQSLSFEDAIMQKAALDIFNKMAEEVCKGQQLDVDFETNNEVRIEDYIVMITWKTSVLLAACMQLGGLSGRASQQDQIHLYEFGKNIGIAFQIQDDVLDTFGAKARVGKRIGGDIVQNKKTYLYLKALELLGKKDAEELKTIFSSPAKDENEKIERVKHLYKESGVLAYAQELMDVYKNLALSHLDTVNVSNENKKEELKQLAHYLIKREL